MLSERLDRNIVLENVSLFYNGFFRERHRVTESFEQTLDKNRSLQILDLHCQDNLEEREIRDVAGSGDIVEVALTRQINKDLADNNKTAPQRAIKKYTDSLLSIYAIEAFPKALLNIVSEYMVSAAPKHFSVSPKELPPEKESAIGRLRRLVPF